MSEIPQYIGTEYTKTEKEERDNEGEGPKYIVIGDTSALMEILTNGESTPLAEQLQTYFDQVIETLRTYLGDRVDVVPYTMSEVDRRLGERIREVLSDDPDSVCICLDRFLLSDIETDARFFRFGIGRTTDGDRVPRQQSPSFEQQLTDLLERMPDLPNRRVTIVDDGIFTGGTIKEFLKIARRNGIQLDVQRVIGFIGTGKSVDEKKPYRDILEPVLDLYEWIDARDFTPVGGTRFSQSRLNKVTTAIPYLFPWSDGGSASLDMEPAFFDISGKLISSFQELVREYERITGTQLTFRDVVKKGFPFPTDAAKKLPITLNTRVIDYLDMCLEKIQQERERPVAIFDMDGTLYKLDGEESGFRGSSLERSVRENAEVFVMKRELCNIDKARTIIAIGQNNVVGLSQYLADRYGISRAEYFNEVWDIDPSNIISGEPSLGNAIQEFIKRNPNVKPVIVSSAPSIWVRRVLKHLGVEDAFELVIAGEKYGVKDEVFRMLSKRYYELSRMVSIGDQMGTDIRPAQKEGIHGILVQGPNETASVLAWLEL